MLKYQRIFRRTLQQTDGSIIEKNMKAGTRKY